MGLFITLFKASFKSQMQYKFDFFVSILGNIFGLLADFIVLAFILLKFKQIEGWQLHEIAVLYGIIEFGFGGYRFIGEGLNKFEELVLSGKFDTLLIRPASALFQVMLQKIDFKRLGMLIQASAVGLWGLQNTTFVNGNIYAYMPVMLTVSVLINLEVSIALSAIAFWTGKNADIVILGHYSTRTAASYPAGIYHNIFSHFLTFVIPFFTVGYYPLLYFTGKSDNGWLLLSPFFGVLMLTPITIIVWNAGIKRYSSSGT